MRTFGRSCFQSGNMIMMLIFLALFLHQKLDVRGDGTLLIDGENKKDSPSSIAALASDPSYEFKHRRSSSRRNDELSPASSTVTESTQAGELISGTKLLAVCFACFIYFYLFKSHFVMFFERIPCIFLYLISLFPTLQLDGLRPS